MKKTIQEMTFREQIGAAGNYGAHASMFARFGFRAPAADGSDVPIPVEILESWIDGFAARDVRDDIKSLVDSQPRSAVFADWSDSEVLKLRASVALRIGPGRWLTEEERNLALARTYTKSRSRFGREDESPYRNDVGSETVSRRDRARLYDQIVLEIESRLRPMVVETIPTENPEETQSAPLLDDFVIVHAFNMYTYPSSIDEKMRVAVTVDVLALRDDVSEYRYTIESVVRGQGSPELEVLAGQGARLERVFTLTRRGVPGYEYQVVFPLSTPMTTHSPSRRFSWIVSTKVDSAFFEPGKNRVVGFRPSRELQSARVSIQFPPAMGPAVVAVNTNVRMENLDLFDLRGDTREVLDGYVDVSWPDAERGLAGPQLAHYCNVVWPR